MRVESCSVTEQTEIFKIVKDLCVFTQNKNGVFLNMINMDDHTVDKIEEYVTFSQKNKSDFALHEKKINEYKLSSTAPIMSACLRTILTNATDYDGDWDKLVRDSKNVERVQKFVKIMTLSAETAVTKRACFYSNACKKYARRAIAVKKVEQEFTNDLQTVDQPV